MDKYTAVTLIEIISFIYVIGIAIVSAIYSWWLLFLILLATTDTAQKRLLNKDE